MIHPTLLRPLRSNVPPLLPQRNRARVDVVVTSLRDLEVDAVGGIGLDVQVAVAGCDDLTGEAGPRGRGSAGLGAGEEAVALLPF